MDYTTLIAGTDTDGSLKNWLNDSTIPATTLLDEAQTWIYRRLRVRRMLLSTTGTATTSQSGIPVDDNYLETRHLMWVGTDKLLMRQALMEDVLDAFSYDGTGAQETDQPTRYYDEGTELTFNCPTDQTYVYRHTYYSQPSLLGTATTTNFLTTKYPYMLRCACMAFATGFTKQPQEEAKWFGLAEQQIASANREDDRRLRDLDLYVRPG